jgi:hypothetical protein
VLAVEVLCEVTASPPSIPHSTPTSRSTPT